MATTKLKLGLTTLVIAGAATTLVIQHRLQVNFGEENQLLRRQVAQLEADNKELSNRVVQANAPRIPRLPAPALTATVPSSPVPADDLQITNLYAQLMAKKARKLTPEQVAPYLDANRRNSASLLAAFRTTGDQALLEEAMQKYPSDPQVAFEAALRKDAQPADRRQWLDALKQSAPDNALANYLSAVDYFKVGQVDQAVQEVVAASGKPHFQDYALERGQDDEEAYRAAGYPVAQAKVVANMQLLLPQLQQVKQLGMDLVNLADSHRQGGDQASAQSALQMAANLGQRYGNPSAGETLISQLVGLAVERNALSAMDPASAYGANGQTVQDRLNQLTQQKAAFRELNQQTDGLWDTMSDQDWLSYHERWKVFGEEEAQRWLVAKHGRSN